MAGSISRQEQENGSQQPPILVSTAQCQPARFRATFYAVMFCYDNQDDEGRMTYSAYVPDILGIAAGGFTLQEAIDNLNSAVPSHLHSMAASKLELPQPKWDGREVSDIPGWSDDDEGVEDYHSTVSVDVDLAL